MGVYKGRKEVLSWKQWAAEVEDQFDYSAAHAEARIAAVEYRYRALLAHLGLVEVEVPATGARVIFVEKPKC